jgi:hypothetical protein
MQRHILQSDLSRPTHLRVALKLGSVASLTILCSAPHSRKESRNSRPSRNQTLLILLQMRPPLAFTEEPDTSNSRPHTPCSNTRFNIIVHLRLVFPFRYSDHNSIQTMCRSNPHFILLDLITLITFAKKKLLIT